MARVGSYPVSGTVSRRDEEEPSGRKVSGLFLFARATLEGKRRYLPLQDDIASTAF
jgi:hypothetical protein